MSKINGLLALPWRLEERHSTEPATGRVWIRHDTSKHVIVSIEEEYDVKEPNNIIYFILFLHRTSSIWSSVPFKEELDWFGHIKYSNLGHAQEDADKIIQRIGFRFVPSETVCLM